MQKSSFSSKYAKVSDAGREARTDFQVVEVYEDDKPGLSGWSIYCGRWITSIILTPKLWCISSQLFGGIQPAVDRRDHDFGVCFGGLLRELRLGMGAVHYQPWPVPVQQNTDASEAVTYPALGVSR